MRALELNPQNSQVCMLSNELPMWSLVTTLFVSFCAQTTTYIISNALYLKILLSFLLRNTISQYKRTLGNRYFKIVYIANVRISEWHFLDISLQSRHIMVSQICLFSYLFRPASKKTPKLALLALFSGWLWWWWMVVGVRVGLVGIERWPFPSYYVIFLFFLPGRFSTIKWWIPPS